MSLTPMVWVIIIIHLIIIPIIAGKFQQAANRGIQEEQVKPKKQRQVHVKTSLHYDRHKDMMWITTHPQEKLDDRLLYWLGVKKADLKKKKKSSNSQI